MQFIRRRTYISFIHAYIEEERGESDADERDVELMAIIHHTDFENCGSFAEAEFGSKSRNDSVKGRCGDEGMKEKEK